jgi:nucleoside-diphosphate-sugar epimerase
VHGESARGEVYRTWADTSRLRSEVGWRPRTSLADGLAAQVAEYRRQHDFDKVAS